VGLQTVQEILLYLLELPQRVQQELQKTMQLLPELLHRGNILCRAGRAWSQQ
jgi:hypothetical protein